MGKRAKSNPAKSVKSHKLNVMKMAGPSQSNKPNSSGTHTHNNNGAQKGRLVSEFDQKIAELQQRNIGQKKTGAKRAPAALPIKPATFRLPTPAPTVQEVQQAPKSTLVDDLLNGERTKQKAEIPKPKRSVASYNPFELLENDELLEDGSHSILKMDIKPATFCLPNR